MLVLDFKVEYRLNDIQMYFCGMIEYINEYEFHEEQVHHWRTQVRHSEPRCLPEGMGYGRNAQAKQEW